MPGDDADNAESFTAFLEGWLLRQQQYLDELLSAASRRPDDGELDNLISRVLSHYEEYYEKKSRIGQRDVFLVFSPTWFTTYERSLLWIGGFRPGMVIRLVNQTINDMSEDQAVRISGLREDMKVVERMLNSDLAKIQETVAAPPLLEIFRQQAGSGQNGVILGETGEIESMKAGFQSVLGNADFLRRDTALKVAEILTPLQNVRFWAAVAQLQLTVRASGLQKDADRRDPTCGGGVQ